jgi:diacylglycerol kinase
VSTATQVESQIVAVESNTTAVESVDVVSVFSAPDVQEAKKIVADAKSMNVIFFIIVCFFVCLFFFVNNLCCFVNCLFSISDIIYQKLYLLF